VNPSAISQGSGTDSLQAMIPMWAIPLLLRTVMFKPAPWKTGPNGYMASIRAPRK